MNRTTISTRFPTRFLVIAATIFSLVALTPTAAAASPRSGDLQITKECSEYNFLPGGFCTITSSNIKAIKVGSQVVYASAPDFGSLTLDSDITVVRQGNSIAYGHVFLDLATGTGTVTLSGGTGQFRGFAANVAVWALGGPDWAWDGSYSFSPG